MVLPNAAQLFDERWRCGAADDLVHLCASGRAAAHADVSGCRRPQRRGLTRLTKAGGAARRGAPGTQRLRWKDRQGARMCVRRE
eukprot:183553-Chlamydomonas_euryale.AAC.1